LIWRLNGLARRNDIFTAVSFRNREYEVDYIGECSAMNEHREVCEFHQGRGKEEEKSDVENVRPANAAGLVFLLGLLGYICWPRIVEVYNDQSVYCSATCCYG